MPRALLSVSNKSGLPAFARGLVRLGFEIYSTGGTLKELETASIDARPISDLTGFPEIMDGRVKTLHPGVHGGLLARRDRPEHMAALDEHGLKPIDLLCVNLYPFAETAANPEASVPDVIEQIDVGGPAMLRAAAKNHRDVIVVVRPERYAEVLTALGAGGVAPATRRQLALEAFSHTAAYDAQIAAWLRGQAEPDVFPNELPIAGTRGQTLRYGENPHQRAAFYRLGPDPGGLGSARQLHGPELSFNNIQDAAAAFSLVNEFDRPAAAIIKHMNPCGLAVAEGLADAYLAAFECDTVSAYGGVLAVNRPLDLATGEAIGGLFLEVIIAPEVAEDVLEALSKKKARVLQAGPVRSPGYDVRSVPGGFLVQSWDTAGLDRAACQVVSKREPTTAEWEQLELAWLAAKHVKSNAIVLARDFAAVGVGAGQMSRVESVRIAVQRAGDRAAGSVMGSDAFFPFPDGVEAGIAAGVTAIIHPGGSKRDAESVAAADAAGVAMVVTGRRHFKH